MDYYQQLALKQGNRCFYCDGGFGDGDMKPTLDHLIPKSRGGKRTHDNLVLAHRKCNQEKGDMPLEIFLNRKKAPLGVIKANSHEVDNPPAKE